MSALPEGAVIERKTPSDMASCIGVSRERFEKEFRRGRYVGRMIVVIEGTLAAWTLRYCPFVFCGSPQEAANFA